LIGSEETVFQMNRIAHLIEELPKLQVEIHFGDSRKIAAEIGGAFSA